MKRSLILCLKVVVLLIAASALVGLIQFPRTEGRAVNLDLIRIYTNPFIIYIYIASVPFFTGLYQAFKLLNLLEANRIYSQDAVNSLKVMKLASISLIGFIALAVFYIRFFANGDDDPAGFVSLGVLGSFLAVITVTAVSAFQKFLQNAIEMN